MIQQYYGKALVATPHYHYDGVVWQEKKNHEWMDNNSSQQARVGKINHLEKKHQQNNFWKREIFRSPAHYLPKCQQLEKKKESKET